ncbi:heterogeneous nuclear ribonucleoprotein [Trifolium repens]|nr:heterogeneous nuclear ribonucleoprotein [Trifolium repens]
MREERETVGGEGSSRAAAAKKKEYLLHLEKVTTSFFITNFPDNASSGDLLKLFLKYGRVAEVYIPRKVDKRGRRFGFVKFMEVSDEDALEDNLREVWMGSFKLWVNRSRFGRSESKEARSKKDQSPIPGGTGVDKGVGRSFRSALVGGAGSGSSKVAHVLKVPVNEELCMELKESVVGTLAREKDARRIQTTLFMEGFPSIVVTPMGGNMVILRSKVEGDVERLLKSKNDCLHYYFSALKPWNPGLMATQREAWIQVYGIPLHIWGENLFKLIGNRMGVFVDFDMETATMSKFDLARIKIITGTWACIDTVMKVEVEGASFNLWLVEERGKHGGVVVCSGEEDVGSQVVVAPVDDVEEEEAESSGGDGISEEDEVSGEEGEVDVSMGEKHEVHVETNDVRVQEGRLPKEVGNSLTFNKSTNLPNLHLEILSAEPMVDGNVALGKGQGEKEVLMVLSISQEEREDNGQSGTNPVKEPDFLNNKLESGGPIPGDIQPICELGLSQRLPAPFSSDPIGPSNFSNDPPFLGRLVEEEVCRCSSISEPEEVLSSHRAKQPKSNPKHRNYKPATKFNPLGVPKCIQLVEAVKEGG